MAAPKPAHERHGARYDAVRLRERANAGVVGRAFDRTLAYA
jgi:hypothetical protein